MRACLLLLVFAAAGIARAEAPQVAYADDRLTLHADQAVAGDILDALARTSGAEIRGAPLPGRTVTADFENVPLQDALQRVLGEQSFTLRYGEGGKLRTVVLRGGPEAPRVPVLALPGATTPSGAGPPPTIGLPHRFADHRPLAIPPPLAEVVGSDTATFDQIFDLATTQPNGVVRALSMQVALSALERERVLRRALFLSLRRGQEGSLGAFLQSPGAIEMLEFMAAHSREPGLQKKANVLLEQVRPAPPPPPAGG